ncbi:MAG: pilus assembly protein [Eubacteriales bacterium]|nr:pilus assembly protein [Eubacteriales bacterium]
MLFPSGRYLYKAHKKFRKEKHILTAGKRTGFAMGRVFPGSMTVEAAIAVPLFVFAMLAILQFAKIEIVSSAVLAGMTDTAKDMAAYAYIRQLGVSAGDGLPAELLTGGISAVYAKSSVERKAGFKEADGILHLWRSSFMQDDIIDLAVTYEAKNTCTILPIPKINTALRARVRAWTGRDGNGSTGENEGDGQQEEMVYVTETGHVYHTNENCTHIRLSIQGVSKDDVDKLRNSSGGKYHACEKCHGGTGGIVYITDYGDRYHSSVGCSGITRNVKQVPVTQVEGWKICSKCSKS